MTFIAVSLDTIQGKEYFPLPLVPIERFMLWDDTPDYPKRFRVILDLRGNLKREMLESAIRLASTRHPLSVARLDVSKQSPCWTIPKQPQIPFRWLEGSWYDPPFDDEWNLTQESGVRVWVSQSSANDYQVGFEVQHASMDGLGLRQFVADMILAYDHECAGNAGEPSLMKLLPEKLLQRGVFTRPKPSTDSRSTTTWEKIQHAYSFHLRGPVPLTLNASHKSQNSKEPKRHIYRRAVLDQEQRERWEHSLRHGKPSTVPEMEDSCNASNTTQQPNSFNDAILARFLQTLANWNQTHNPTSQNQRLRVMIPTELRGFSDGRMPAANRFGFGFVVSDIVSSSDLPTLMDQVSKQTQAIRKYWLGLDFVEIFGAFAAFPRLAQRIVRVPRCMATGVLTNLGDLSRRHRRSLVDADESIKIGNTVLTSVTCFPPLRPKTVVGIGVCGTRDSFTIGIILDAKHGTVQDADTLLSAMSRT